MNTKANCVPMIMLAEISHPDLSTNIYIANWIDDVASNGNNYLAARFEGSLPNDRQGEKPSVKLRFDNVGRALTQWIEQSCGGRCGKIILSVVAKDCPDEVTLNLCCRIASVCMDCNVVELTLWLGDFHDRKAMQKVFNECTAPGLA